MSYDIVYANIKTTDGQTFSTYKFNVSKIRDEVRILTGLPDIVIDKFIPDIIEEFCEKTWLLRKTIEIGDVLEEETIGEDDYSEFGTDEYTAWGISYTTGTADAGFYSVFIDLSEYIDGLVVHDINGIYINDIKHNITKSAFLGDITTPVDTSSNNYHYAITNEQTINIYPLNLLTDTIKIPIIFKTADTATEIPYLLEEYYREIASGVIAKIRLMPRYQAEDAAYHAQNFKSGISAGKHKYSKQYKGKLIVSPNFAL